MLWATDTEQGNSQRPTDWETIQAVLENGHSFEAFGFFQGGGAPVTLSGVVVSRVEQMPVDVNGLAITGVAPFLGRTHRPRTSRTPSSRRKHARSWSRTRPGSGCSAARPT